VLKLSHLLWRGTLGGDLRKNPRPTTTTTPERPFTPYRHSLPSRVLSARVARTKGVSAWSPYRSVGLPRRRARACRVVVRRPLMSRIVAVTCLGNPGGNSSCFYICRTDHQLSYRPSNSAFFDDQSIYRLYNRLRTAYIFSCITVIACVVFNLPVCRTTRTYTSFYSHLESVIGL